MEMLLASEDEIATGIAAGFGLLFGLGMLVAIALLMFFLGGLPGKIAASRNHPYAKAVKVLGWVGIFTYGAAWLAALIWAYCTPEPAQGYVKIQQPPERPRKKAAGGLAEAEREKAEYEAWKKRDEANYIS
jgi:hypothetical protein